MAKRRPAKSISPGAILDWLLFYHCGLNGRIRMGENIMNTQHEMAMQLLGACLIINEIGKYHAHYNYAPHTDAVYVQVLSGDTVYDGASIPEHMADLTVYLARETAEQDCADAIKKLKEFMV